VIHSEDNLTFKRLDRPGGVLKGQGLTMVDHALGIQLEPHSQPNHIVAKGEFTATSDVTPEWDYKRMLSTLSLYTDEPIRVVLATTTPQPGELTRKKVIEMPWAEFHYAIPGTIMDFDPAGSGAAAFTIADNDTGVTLRDDTPQMRQVAYLARHWYGETRQILEMTYGVPYVLSTLLGVIVDDLANGESTVPVKTLVSEIRYDLGENRQTMNLRTSFYQLDISRILRPQNRRGGGGGGHGRHWEGSNELGRIPSVVGGGGGGGASAYAGQFAVTLDAAFPGTRIKIAAGKVIAGVTVIDYAGNTGVTPGGVCVWGTAYYNNAWYVIVETGATYPTQAKQGGTYWAHRKLFATLTIVAGVVTHIEQEHIGEWHLTGVV
jgi:hypothetical protein